MEKNPPVTLLTPNTVSQLCKTLDIRPTKQLGQNFVTEPSAIRKIVREAGVKAGEQVLEVGPGLGSLTLGLLEVGACVAACEIDSRLAAFLPATIASHAPQSLGRAYLVNKDALKLVPADLENLAALSESAGETGKELDMQQDCVQSETEQHSGKAFLPEILVSNLPYNVAVPVLLHLFAVFPSLKRALVMVQKEVAVRLSASAGSKVYGVPSVKIAWYGKARMKSDISRRVFYPQPNVDSALVEIVRAPSSSLCFREDKQKGYLSSEKEISGHLEKTLTAQEQEHRQREVVFELIDCAFASRRKMLRSSLKTWAAPLAVAPLLSAAGIAPTSRAETLTIRDFAALAKLRSVLASRVEKSPIIPKKTTNNMTTLEREENSAPASLPAAPSKPSLSAAETASARQAQAVSNGKINLFLAATRENDGYHPLSTLFQAVNLREKVTISLQEQGLDIDVNFDAPEGAVGYSPDRDQQALTGLQVQNNLATRAFLLVAQQCGYQGGAKITIEKQVPVAGGMAGGSADAAAALLAANQVLAAGLSRNQLAEIGAKLGADVPFGLYGGTCFADRYGDRITPLPPANSLSLVAAVSPNTLATPEVFRQYDKSKFLRQKLPNLAELNPLLQALYQADLSVLAKLIQNDLQNPAIKLLPQLAVTLETAKQQGAVAFISGSGPTVIALVQTDSQARALAVELAKLDTVSYALPLTFSIPECPLDREHWLA